MSDLPIVVTPGREGQSNVTARRLVAFVKLPDHRINDALVTAPLRDADVRDAMARAARQLHDRALTHSAEGFVWSLDDIEYEVARIGEGPEAVPTVVASLRIVRP